MNIGVGISEKSKLLRLQLFYEDVSLQRHCHPVRIDTVRVLADHQSAMPDHRLLITDY
jgi:hypothetical protein